MVLTRVQDYAPASPGPDPKRGGDVPATVDWVATYAGAHEAQSEGGKDSDDKPAMAYGSRGKRPTERADTGRPVDFGCPRKAAPERNRHVPATPAQGQARVPEKGGSSEGCSPSRGHHAEVMCGRITMTPPFVGLG
ncbi:hypothetical protein HPB50_013653 [Hyalomma asiaticum]|uniref:Uncharacterized protein n=1 Tax=Hyalomma asiaticum TaxID=266040 RepID=A0ACB7TNN0_HYAAI|nr:hypothetical protein HPB50_013653 [Hyalomma asiaticum]